MQKRPLFHQPKYRLELLFMDARCSKPSNTNSFPTNHYGDGVCFFLSGFFFPSLMETGSNFFFCCFPTNDYLAGSVFYLSLSVAVYPFGNNMPCGDQHIYKTRGVKKKKAPGMALMPMCSWHHLNQITILASIDRESLPSARRR